jgi:type I restriction enzyme S subunit
MKKQLPKNWVETDAKSISNIIRGVSYGKTDAFQYPFDNCCLILRGGNIQDGKIVEGKDNVYVDIKLIKSEQFLKEGDVVVVGSTGSERLIGKAATNLLDKKDESFGAFMMTIRPSTLINKWYFSYFYQTDYYRDEIRNLAGGVNINNIRKEYLENLKFPLPPLAEQHRIVAKLDMLFTQLETIKTSMANIPLLLKDFRQQVLTQAVTGKLTEEWRKRKDLEEWKDVELGKICNLKAGKFVSASEISNEKLEGYFPCYGGNGLRGYVNSFTHTGRYSLIGRQGALCGNVHLIEGQFHATEHALVVTPLTNIDKIWMFYKLTSLELINYSKGVAQPGLSVMNLNPIAIEIPPLEEQQEIVSRVESLFAKADAIEQQYKTLKASIVNLPQALLHKAFKGELTEQLDSDGDARELLEEIQELKGARTKVAKNTKLEKLKAFNKKVKKYPKSEDILGMVAEPNQNIPL